MPIYLRLILKFLLSHQGCRYSERVLTEERFQCKTKQSKSVIEGVQVIDKGVQWGTKTSHNLSWKKWKTKKVELKWIMDLFRESQVKTWKARKRLHPWEISLYLILKILCWNNKSALWTQLHIEWILRLCRKTSMNLKKKSILCQEHLKDSTSSLVKLMISKFTASQTRHRKSKVTVTKN